MNIQRFGSVVGVKEDQVEEYKRLHADVWPEVLAIIKTAHISNYSIYLRRLPDGNMYLFSYMEYTGNDFASDMAALADEPKTQEWWDACMPCHEPLPDRLDGEWWASMEEVFHFDTFSE